LTLRVEEPQAWPSGAVLDQPVDRQPAGVAGPQPGLDQHDHQMAGGGIGDAGQVALTLQLRHHRLGNEPGQVLSAPGHVVGIQRRVVGQPGQPVVAAAGVQEAAQADEVAQPGLRREVCCGQPDQVSFQQSSGDHRLVPGGRGDLGDEPREPGQREGVTGHGADRFSAAQPVTAPTLGRRSQPGLRYVAEANQVAAAVGW